MSDIPGTTRDAIDTRLAWGRSEVVLDRHGRDPPARQGRLGPGRGALLDAAGAQGAVAGRRRRARHRRRRGPDRAGRPRRGLRRRRGQGPRHRGQQVGPRRRQDGPDLRPVRRVDPQRGAVPRLRAGRVDQRQDRPARRPGARDGRRHLGRAAQADLDRRAEPAARERHRAHAAAAGPWPPAEALLRDPGRRRAADVRLLRLTTRRRSTSATGATSRTGCARRSASTAPRSGSSSATGARSSCHAGGRAAARRRRPPRDLADPDPRHGPASHADGRPEGRGRRGRGVGDDPGQARRERRAGHPVVPLGRGGGGDRRESPQRAPPARRGPAGADRANGGPRDPGRRAGPGRLRDALALSPGECDGRRAASRTECGRAQRGQGPRACQPAPDERGDRRGRRSSAGSRGGAVGSEPGRSRSPAACPPPRSSRPATRSSPSGSSPGSAGASSGCTSIATSSGSSCVGRSRTSWRSPPARPTRSGSGTTARPV